MVPVHTSTTERGRGDAPIVTSVALANVRSSRVTPAAELKTNDTRHGAGGLAIFHTRDAVIEMIHVSCSHGLISVGVPDEPVSGPVATRIPAYAFAPVRTRGLENV